MFPTFRIMPGGAFGGDAFVSNESLYSYSFPETVAPPLGDTGDGGREVLQMLLNSTILDQPDDGSATADPPHPPE